MAERAVVSFCQELAAGVEYCLDYICWVWLAHSEAQRATCVRHSKFLGAGHWYNKHW
jgi:hypothetical protein